MVLARICTTAITMTYPACLSTLLSAWDMSAVEAGIVQGAFTLAFAVSLLIVSPLCDRFDARRVLLWSTACSALAALVFAIGARSYETALILMALVGLSQGGTYIPAILLVSAEARPERRNASVGWILAGMSAGYVVSIFLSTTLVTLHSYQAAFIATAGLAAAGYLLTYLATRQASVTNTASPSPSNENPGAHRRTTVLLTVGYVGHCWELFGMWAWVPAFLATALLLDGQVSGVELGLWTALCLHGSGFFASFLSGYAADRFGVRPVLIGFAILGLSLSLTLGWLVNAPAFVLLGAVAIYGFATIGDSAVLSAAMTEAVPAKSLGRVLGIRSILGIGGGAISPVLFGLTLDLMPGAFEWAIAFGTLAVGGAMAFFAALALADTGTLRSR
ncbi:MAG: MFS transporter [Rhodobacter sp.]|nr:MFS transporter [Rhodobacter sp.]